MRYMLIMRSTPEAEEASKDIPFEEIINAMGRYNDELIKAGVMLAGEGLFNGFWMLEVSSKEEAAEWAKKCPLGPGVKLEVRRVPTIDEFPQDNEYIQKEKAWREEHDPRTAS